MRHLSLTWVALLVLSCASSRDRIADAATSSSAAAGDAGMREAAKAQLGELASAAATYETTVGKCPGSVDDLVQRGLIANAPNDPWGTPIAFMPKSAENPKSAFVSAGPDKELLTSDDIETPVSCLE